MNLFKRKSKPAVLRVRANLGISAETWRKSEELVTKAGDLLRSDLGRSILDVLSYESPHNLHLPGADLPARALHQARIEGYNLCLNNLESLGTPDTGSGDLTEATFSKPE